MLGHSAEVTPEEGREMAESIGAVAYVETSAMTGEGVRQVFITAVRYRHEGHRHGPAR